MDISSDEDNDEGIIVTLIFAHYIVDLHYHYAYIDYGPKLCDPTTLTKLQQKSLSQPLGFIGSFVSYKYAYYKSIISR